MSNAVNNAVIDINSANSAKSAKSSKKITFASILQAFFIFCFAAALMHSALSGSYAILTTPRAFAYLIFAAILLFALGICSLFGVFSVCAKDSKKILVSIAVPMLIILIPLQMAQSSLGGGSLKSAGFDEYASGRAIPIASNHKNNKKILRGLDEANKKIVVLDDDFGNWYNEIDHNFDKYKDYTIVVKGFISREATLSKNQVRVSRQFMSCCILDMSPFGFVAQMPNNLQFSQHQWVVVKAKIALGKVGLKGYSQDGIVLKVESASVLNKAPSGYFYRT